MPKSVRNVFTIIVLKYTQMVNGILRYFAVLTLSYNNNCDYCIPIQICIEFSDLIG